MNEKIKESNTEVNNDNFGINKIEGAHYKDLGKIDETLNGYYITNTGYVFKLSDRRYLHPHMTVNSEPVVSINIGSERTKDGRENYKVAELAAQMYVPNPDPENLKYIGYKNGDPVDCSSENLQWVDRPTFKPSDVSKRPLYVICDASGHPMERFRTMKDAYEGSGYNGTFSDFSCLFIRNELTFDPRKYKTNYPNGYVTTQEAIDAFTKK